jgi:hypothetical protein
MAEPVDSELLRQIVAPLESGSKRGVAYLVGRDRAVTNGHLLSQDREQVIWVDGDRRTLEIERTDAATGLASVRFQPPLSRDIPALAATGDASDRQVRFSTLGYPSGPDRPVLVSGSVIGAVTRAGRNLIQIEVDSGPSFPGLSGAPVVVGNRVIGVISDALTSSSGVPSSTLFVVPVSAVIALLGTEASPGPVFQWLSASSSTAIQVADAMRRALNQPKLHMEHLIAGLYAKPGGPTHTSLRAAGVDDAKLHEIIKAATKIDLPTSYSVVELTAMPPLSKHSEQAIEAARRITTDGIVHSRDLFAGVMSIADCGPVKALLAAGVRGAPAATPNPPPSQARGASPIAPIEATLAGFRSDGVTEQTDLLDIKLDVEALASVIAARDVEPPLSIGLFGDWGSGKSFFIEDRPPRRHPDADQARTGRQAAEAAASSQGRWHEASAARELKCGDVAREPGLHL